MIIIYTFTEAQKEFIDRGYIPLFNNYEEVTKKLLAQTQEGYKIVISLSKLKSGRIPYKFDVHNPYTIQNIRLWCELNNKPFELISEQYENARKKLKWKCLKEGCKEVFEETWDYIKQNHNCPFCAGRQVGLSNCIATTNPELIIYLKNNEDKYNFTVQSEKKCMMICPNCGHTEEKRICDLSKNKGYPCPRCSDGKSYPEKFIFYILEQLNINFITQLSKTIFKWCNGYKYDLYIPNLNCIIEAHGVQHYKETTRGRSLKEEQENDKNKKELALKNNIKHYIIIDCKYSDLVFIKNNIMQSELPQLLNFKEEDINWIKCHEFACNSLVKIACNLWNEGINNVQVIANKLKISRGTARKYLKRGTQANICNYNSELEKLKRYKNLPSGKNHSNATKIICITTGEIFNYIKEASKKYKITHITDCCQGKRNYSGKLVDGTKLVWMYYEDYLIKNII